MFLLLSSLVSSIVIINIEILTRKDEDENE